MNYAKVISGHEVVALLDAERERLPRSLTRPDLFLSEPLCELQRRHAERGYIGATLVDTIYGWSVRYDSGLQNFGLIASSRAGQVDGTKEDAIRAANEWQQQDPKRRYVWERA